MVLEIIIDDLVSEYFYITSIFSLQLFFSSLEVIGDHRGSQRVNLVRFLEHRHTRIRYINVPRDLCISIRLIFQAPLGYRGSSHAEVRIIEARLYLRREEFYTFNIRRAAASRSTPKPAFLGLNLRRSCAKTSEHRSTELVRSAKRFRGLI